MGLLDFRSLEESSTEFTGTVGVDYLYDDVTGILLVDDDTGYPLTADGAELGRMVFVFSEAVAGLETITGTGALAFGFSEAASGLETFTGTGSLAFGFAEAATGAEGYTGTSALAFGFSEAAAGTETFTGSGALVYPFSLAASGTVADGAVTGTGSLTFGFAEAGTGQNAGITGGHHAVGVRGVLTYVPPEPKAIPPVTGHGGVVFGFSLDVTAQTNDDDLAILLAA